jgi:N-methylhydantoinase A
VPMLPGVFCSVGMLASDVEHNFVRTVLCKLMDARARDIHPVMVDLRNEGLEMLLREGYQGRAAQLEFSADLRYVGQSSELTVPLPESSFTEKARVKLHASFQNEYLKTFGYNNEEPIELVNIRLAARGVRANRLSFESAVAVERDGAVSAPKRKVLFGRSTSPRTTPVIRRSTISRQRNTGPAIVESYDSTLVIPPRATFRRDDRGSIVIELG